MSLRLKLGLFVALLLLLTGCKPPPHFKTVRQVEKVRVSLFGMRGDKQDRAYKVFTYGKKGLETFRRLLETRKVKATKCAPMGKVEFFVAGKVDLDVEFTLQKGCQQGRYLHKKKLYAWGLSPDAVKFLTFLFHSQLPKKALPPGVPPKAK